MERNCAFQYAKINGQFFKNTEIVCDESRLTLDEAKGLWNQYYPVCQPEYGNSVT